jgi:hypothetical protein
MTHAFGNWSATSIAQRPNYISHTIEYYGIPDPVPISIILEALREIGARILRP